ncbi:MAG: hypothetical protein HY585_05750, partial [Candidatus Omnitrophica bacterium]|nr:hypothetical protein [Candidatus Omnitrophota bacterium]
MEIYKRLIAYIKPYRTRMVLAVICTLLYTIAHSLVSVTVFVILNGLQNKDRVVIDNMPEIQWLPGFKPIHFDIPAIEFPIHWVPFFVIAVFSMRGIFEYISRYQVSIIGLRAIRKVRDDLYAHLVKLSMSFYSRGRTGELMSRTMHDVGVIQGGITDVLIDLVQQPFIILFQIPLVFFWGGPLALIALVMFPTIAIPIILLGRKIRKAEQKVQEQVANIHSGMQETFSGMNVVKAFNMENYEIRKFEGINKTVFNFLRRTVKLTIIQRPLVEVIGSLAIAFSIWYGIKILPLDRFASFITTLFLFYEPLKKLSKVNSSIQQSVAAGTRIFELMDEVPQIQNQSGAVPLKDEIKTVRFNDIALAYKPEKKVLKGISFEA